MKTVIAFALLIVGITAAPRLEVTEADLKEPRFVTNAIESVIDDIRHKIRDLGLDPLYIEEESIKYELPVAVLFNIEAILQELEFTGLSNIKTNNLSFNLITTRLTFDIELPEIRLSVKRADAQFELFGEDYSVSFNGVFAINSIRVRGTVRVSLGIISGISIRDLTINSSLGGIESDLNVNIFGFDLSNKINSFLGEKIPNTLSQYSKEIDQLLEIVALKIAESIL